METLLENIYRRNDIQWLEDRLHTFQNVHQLKNFLRDNNHISEVDKRKIVRYVIKSPPLIPETEGGVTAATIYKSVEEAIDDGMRGVSKEMITAAHAALHWKLPGGVKIPWTLAESIAVIIVNLLDNIIARQRQCIDRVTVRVGNPERRSALGMPTKVNNLYISIVCETKAEFDPAMLDRIGIAPSVPQSPAEGGFGMFLVGVLARLNGGIFDIDRSLKIDRFRVFQIILPLKGEAND